MSEAIIEIRASAKTQRTHGNSITRFDVGDAGANFGNGCRCFVANDLRVGDSGVHCAVENVNVGSTDTAKTHVESYFPVARWDRLAGADSDSFIPLVLS